MLRLLSQGGATQRRIYQASAVDCRRCKLRERCTTSPRGRLISRDLDEAYVARARGYHETEAFARAMRTRKVWVEPLFAGAKDWRGRRRFQPRGLMKVNGEALLIAARPNLKRLLSKFGWGRRSWPNGAAGLVLPASAPAAPAFGERTPPSPTAGGASAPSHRFTPSYLCDA